MTGSRLRYALLALYLVALSAVTLTPQAVSEPVPPEGVFCLLCGERGAADALLNILLFAPLGAIIQTRTTGPWWSRLLRWFLVGVVLSSFIELSQLWIPGRHPTASDILFNGIGTSLGALLLEADPVRTAREGVGSRVLAAGWAAAVVAYMGLAGVALQPSVTEGVLYGQWTPSLGGFEHYQGQVIDAEIGGVPIPSGRIAPDRQSRLREMLRSEAPVEVQFVLGPPPESFAPIFNVFDGDQRPILLFGADGRDLIYRRRYVANDLHLDRPDHRIPGVLGGLEPGDTVSVQLEAAAGGGYRVTVDTEPRRMIAVGHTVGRSWSLLLYSAQGNPDLARASDLLWLALLGLPIGLWSSWPGVGLGTTAGVVAALLLLPAMTVLVSTPLLQYLGFVAGVLLPCSFRVALATDDPG